MKTPKQTPQTTDRNEPQPLIVQFFHSGCERTFRHSRGATKVEEKAMKNTNIRYIFAAALVAATFYAPAQSFVRDITDAVDATLDASRENREQNAAPDEIKAIFAKARKAKEEDNKINFCGFYTGMSNTDARKLAEWYSLSSGEWYAKGSPVYEIQLSLKAVRRITKGGNTFEELVQSVANRVGDMKGSFSDSSYSMRTIDDISVTMRPYDKSVPDDYPPFCMYDHNLRQKQAERARLEEQERKAREERERKAREERKEQERRAREEQERKAREEREASLVDAIAASMVKIPGKNYLIGMYEVSQSQWEDVMEDNPSHFKGRDLPVEMVSWDDCQLFLSKLNSLSATKKAGLTFRLPTEAEWLFACRAGSTGDYCRLADGTDIKEDRLGDVAWFSDNSEENTHPVGQRKPNAFGLCDMIGNVQEWCQETLGEVESWAKGKPDEVHRISRGGSWLDSAGNCRLIFRGVDERSARNGLLGFRLCVSERTSGEKCD